jgi:flagellin
MIINHNLSAMNANRMVTVNSNNASKAMAKLSSGLRINSAADDAAGLAISEKMKGQISGLNTASSNAQNGISMVQTADGALTETTSVLQRMRELAVQSATDTNTTSDRAAIQTETDQLAKQITNISNTTEFNTQNLLAGGLADTLQIGANAGQNMKISVSAMDATSLGVAGQTITQGATTAVGGVSTVTSVGSGLSAQTYKLATTATAATTAAAATAAAGTTGGASTTGVIGGAYTGAANAQLQIRVDAVDGAFAPTSVSTSFDGGKTFSASTAYSAAMNIGNGLTFTKDAGNYAAGNIESTTLNAASYSMQLQTAGGVNVGGAVTVNNAQTSAVIGDSTVGATMTVGFTAGGISTAAAGNFQAISATASTSAVISNGVVTSQANTVAGIDVSSQGAANAAITSIDKATATVSAQRAVLGAYQNRLSSTINNLGTTSQNLSSAQSSIADVDMAATMAEYSKDNIESQAAQALIAQANANTAIKAIDTATAKVSTERAKLGADQNRLESTINNLGTTSQNLSTAQSSIADVDMAATMAEYSKDNVESQAAQAMIAQANQQPQQVLSLLK